MANTQIHLYFYEDMPLSLSLSMYFLPHPSLRSDMSKYALTTQGHGITKGSC